MKNSKVKIEVEVETFCGGICTKGKAWCCRNNCRGWFHLNGCEICDKLKTDAKICCVCDIAQVNQNKMRKNIVRKTSKNMFKDNLLFGNNKLFPSFNLLVPPKKQGKGDGVNDIIFLGPPRVVYHTS